MQVKQIEFSNLLVAVVRVMKDTKIIEVPLMHDWDGEVPALLD